MSRPEQRPARHPHAGLLASVLTAVVVLDQGSKALIRSHLPVGDRAPLLSGVLELVHLENRGIAWGLLSGHALRLPLVTLLSLATFVVMLGWYRRLRDDERGLAWSLALVLGGATGNVLDRLLYGRVTDFVELSAPGAIGDAARRLVGGDSWAVFNMADVAITSGILLFAALALSGRAHPPRLGPGTAAPGPADAPGTPESDSPASPVERPR